MEEQQAEKEQQRTEMPGPEIDNSAEEKKKEVPQKRLSEQLTDMVPAVNFDMDVNVLVQAVKQAYLRHTIQPSYSLIRYRPGKWVISRHPQSGTKRVTFKEFTEPMDRGSSLHRLKNRLYEQATYARWKLTLNALLGTIMTALLKQHDFKGFTVTDDDGDTHSVRGTEVNIAMMPNAAEVANLVTLAWVDGQGREATAPLDPSPRTSVVLARAGGGCISIDVASDNPVRVIKSASNNIDLGNAMGAEFAFEQSSMILQSIPNMRQVMLMIIAESVALVKEYNAMRKKRSKNRRRKRRQKKKKVSSAEQPISATS